MGVILEPIFTEDNPWLISLLSFFLVMIAVLEVYFTRVSHRHRFMFLTILSSLAVSVSLIGFLGSFYAIQSSPWYKPTQFIPVFGMLIGNSMASVAVSLNGVMSDISQNKEGIEMLLAFGASRWEAAQPICVKAIKLAMLPILNSQSVMGLISIPGMTAGQILGGVPVQDAINYQLIVTFMYVSATGLATVFAVLGAVYSIFDGDSRLRLDRIFEKKKRTPFITLFRRFWQRKQRPPSGSSSESEPLLATPSP